MNDRIRRLMEQLHQIEDELAHEVREHERRAEQRIREGGAELEASVRAAHRRLRRGVMRWMLRSEWRNLVTAPLIYLMILPLLLLDGFLFVYQLICFPLYRIARPARGDYISFDRGRLQYLNFLERLNCNYCAYANGLFAYAREVAVRTEQYWCPIKHARRLRGTHTRHARYLDFGDAEGWADGSVRLRNELVTEGKKD